MRFKFVPENGVSQINRRKQKSKEGVGLLSEKIADQGKANHQEEAECEERIGIFVAFQVKFKNLVNKHAGVWNNKEEQPFFKR